MSVSGGQSAVSQELSQESPPPNQASPLRLAQPSKKKQFSTRMKSIATNPTTLAATYLATPSQNEASPRTRNNEAAKRSRMRKKIYTTLLQKQITEMELQLFDATDELEHTRSLIFNALMHTDEVNKNCAQMQSHILKKLKHLVKMGEDFDGRDTEINISLDSCIYRIGASGSERRAILDILYTGMINRNLPNIYRYLLWAAANQQHLFTRGEGQAGQWWEEIKEVGEDVIQKNGEVLEKGGEQIGAKGREIYRCAQDILRIKKEIEGFGQDYDQVLKQIREILNPVQFAELFLFVERSIHRKQLQIFAEDQDEVSLPQDRLEGRKRVKLNEIIDGHVKIQES